MTPALLVTWFQTQFRGPGQASTVYADVTTDFGTHPVEPFTIPADQIPSAATFFAELHAAVVAQCAARFGQPVTVTLAEPPAPPPEPEPEPVVESTPTPIVDAIASGTPPLTVTA